MENIINKLKCITQNDLENIKLGKNKEKKIIKISNFISKNFKHYYHAFDYRQNFFDQTNIFKLINVYGYGNCVHYAFLFAFLMDILKVKNELIFLKSKKKNFSHIINIIYLKKKKFWIDLDHNIFEYKDKLIPIDGIKEIIIKTKILEINYKKKFIENIYLYKNKKTFKDRYDSINASYLEGINNFEIFNLYENNFHYKSKMKKFFSKNYFYNQPLWLENQPNKLFNTKNSIGFIDGKLSKEKKYKFKNKVIKFSNILDNNFVLNNFPFPITNIKINGSIKSKVKLFILDDKIKNYNNFSFSKYLLKKKIRTPIYSFRVNSNLKIKNIKVEFLISDFRLKFYKFLKRL